MLIREIGAHYEYSWRSISGKASMMKEAKPNWQQVDFPSESVTSVTATSEKEVDTLTRLSDMNERQNKSQGGYLGSQKVSPLLFVKYCRCADYQSGCEEGQTSPRVCEEPGSCEGPG